MFETIYLPSQRVQKRFTVTNAGLSRFRNNTGKVINAPSRAYQSGITKIQDNVQLSQPTVIASPAPFSIPIRNASYNLNADPKTLYRTPRSGLLWRVVGKEGEDVNNEPRKSPQYVPPGKASWPLKTKKGNERYWQQFCITIGNPKYYTIKYELASILAQEPVAYLDEKTVERLQYNKRANVMFAILDAEKHNPSEQDVYSTIKEAFKRVQETYLYEWWKELNKEA